VDLDGCASQPRLRAATRARLDTQVIGHHERAFCMLLDDRLITDHHVTMIGYGKSGVSDPQLSLSSKQRDCSQFFYDWMPLFSFYQLNFLSD